MTIKERKLLYVIVKMLQQIMNYNGTYLTPKDENIIHGFMVDCNYGNIEEKIDKEYERSLYE